MTFRLILLKYMVSHGECGIAKVDSNCWCVHHEVSKISSARIVAKEILNSRYNKPCKRKEWYIKWKGFGSEKNTWEPLENLAHAPELLKESDKKGKGTLFSFQYVLHPLALNIKPICSSIAMLDHIARLPNSFRSYCLQSIV